MAFVRGGQGLALVSQRGQIPSLLVLYSKIFQSVAPPSPFTSLTWDILCPDPEQLSQNHLPPELGHLHFIRLLGDSDTPTGSKLTFPSSTESHEVSRVIPDIIFAQNMFT